jgi:hypothetical protein
MTDDRDLAWLTAVGQELGLELDTDQQQFAALDELARHVGTDVDEALTARTLFLVGVASGRAADPSVATHDFAGKLVALARGWNADTERAEPANDQDVRG